MVDLSHTETRFNRRWIVASIAVGLATFTTFLVAILAHLRMLQVGQESHFWEWVLGEAFDWFSWAALVPLIFWLGRKVRITRQTLLWSTPVHFLFAAILSTVTLVVGVLGSVWAHNETVTSEQLISYCYREVIWMAPWSIFIYTGILSAYYAYEYYRRYNERELATSRLETELTKAQLDSLYSQLQPHFLFNTLNTISVLMRKGQIEEAQRTLSRLSDLLRYVLARENTQEVPLETELGFVQGYLAIEQVRFGERLQVAMTIDPESMRARIPSFVLQMLVENAVRHGVANKAGVGHISIEATRENGNLRVTVQDDGVGLNQTQTRAEGVGLKNTRSRLQHLYGPDHAFELVSPTGGGTKATLSIPYHE